MSKGKLESIIKVESTTTLASVTDSAGLQSVSVVADDYYLSSIGTGSESFIDHVETQLNGAGLNGTYTVTMSSSGIVTISCTESFSVAWQSTSLRDLLGYTGNLGSATSHAATEQAEGVWYPDGEYQTLNGGGTWQGWWRTDKQDRVSPAGDVFSVYGQKMRKLSIRWPAISRARAWIANESTANKSFESFMKKCILGDAAWAQTGGPIRWHADETDDASYYSYSVLGFEEWRPDMVQQNFTGMWVIELPELIQLPSEVS